MTHSPKQTLETGRVALVLTQSFGLTEAMTDETRRRRYRRRRGAMTDPQMLGYMVESVNKVRWDALADYVEMSPSELFDLMVENIQLDAYGRPVWLPAQPLKDGVLPIDTA